MYDRFSESSGFDDSDNPEGEPVKYVLDSLYWLMIFLSQPCLYCEFYHKTHIVSVTSLSVSSAFLVTTEIGLNKLCHLIIMSVLRCER